METLDNLIPRLDQLNDICASLSNERNFNLQRENILLAAKAITAADGTLYLLTEECPRLHFEIVRTDAVDIAVGEQTSGKFPDLSLWFPNGRPNNMVAA